jgi:hypothetical protein
MVGIHFNIRHGDKADSTIILTALGVDLRGTKEEEKTLTFYEFAQWRFCYQFCSHVVY